MSLIRFALMGAQGTGKTYIVDRIKNRAQSLGIDVQVVVSPTRDIKRLGDFKNNHGLTWDFQMMCIAERRKRQLEAYERVRYLDRDESPKHGLILADRCGLDEIAYQVEKITREAPGDNVDLAAFTSMVHPFARGTALWWDKVWFKPVHPDYPPVDDGDGDRSASKQYQSDVERIMLREFEKLCQVSNYTGILNPDRDKAVDDIWFTLQLALGLERA